MEAIVVLQLVIQFTFLSSGHGRKYQERPAFLLTISFVLCQVRKNLEKYVS